MLADDAFSTGTHAQATFKSRLYGIGYRCSFLIERRVETGVSVGLKFCTDTDTV